MLQHIDGFDQFTGQSGSQLLGSLAAAGYTVTQGLAIAAGRHASTQALELRVSAGTAGTAWSRRTNSVRVALNAVAGDGAGRWIAVGEGGVAAISLDSITWQPLVMGVSVTLRGVCFADGRWVVVGDNGTILTSDDGGGTWALKSQPLTGAIFNGVAFGNDKLVAVGRIGTTEGCILVSSDKGDIWAKITINAGTYENQCVSYGDNSWLVGGKNGQLRKSVDALTWATGASGITTDITSVAYGDEVWMLPSVRTVRQSNDGGTTWTEVANNLGTTTSSFSRIAYAPGRWLIGGVRGGLMTSENRTAWTTRPLPGSTAATEVRQIGVANGAISGLVVVGTPFVTNPPMAMIYASLAPPTLVSRTMTVASSKLVIGFAHKATARGRILSVANLFDMEWPGGLSILDTPSVAIPIRNAWYYYELVIDKLAQTVSLFVNDTTDIVVPLPAAVTSMTKFTISWVAENGAIARIDDLYLLDNAPTDGATLIDRLKPIRIPLRLPTADSEVQWEGSAPGPHYALVGLLPPSDASYVRSAESGAQELFTSDTALPAGAETILAVGVLALAKKSDVDNRQLGLVVGPAGPSQREVIDTTLSVSAEYSLGIFEKGPSGATWTPANVLTTPFGVVVRP